VRNWAPYILAATAIGAGAHARAAGAGSIVAADGSGQFRSVQEAVNDAPQTCSASSPWTIRVLPGTYRELVYVQREKRFVRLVGRDPARTIISYDLRASMPGSDGKQIGTFRTPTLWIDADDFEVDGLTIENSAGPVGQALALRVDGDRVIFRKCRFLGWQDTILADRGRQYFGDCTIQGAVDFIFGGATALFDSCDITCVGSGYITAASTPEGQEYGFVFSGCRISGVPGSQTYLGRPWRPYADVIFLNTRMSEVVRPSGWHNWNKPERERTSRFAEFGSTGAGADAAARVPWARTLTAAEAAAVTPQRVLSAADGWRPQKAAD
jgi:pectinesterase